MMRMLVTVVCSAMLLAVSPRPHLELSSGASLKTLESLIPHVELTVGAEGIGGATVEDAVVMLRQLTEFPINIELIEYDTKTDALTLGAALDQLHALKAQRKLLPQDEGRLRRYEELATVQARDTQIGFKKKTFVLVRDNISVRALLDLLMELDDSYMWRNAGTNNSPVIVVQPRRKSALDWPVPGFCGKPEEMSSSILYRAGGKLTALFQAHNISRLELNDRSKLPDVQLDLCRDDLNARDVLNLTVVAAGQKRSWSLSGIKGLRWLTFQ